MGSQKNRTVGNVKEDTCGRMNIRRRSPIFLSGILAVGFICLHGMMSSAATFIINDPSDTTKLTSLRGAIIKANSSGANNTIILEDDLYPLTVTGADENFAHTGDLDITKGNLFIIGASATKVTIDASALGDRVFQVSPGAHLTLSNLVITGGTAPAGIYDPSGSNGEDGGGIYNQGVLTLDHCVVSGNTSGRGGDASSMLGVGGNGGNGAGIYNIGTLVLRDSLVTSNFNGFGGNGVPLEGNGGSNGQGGNGGNGGGIYSVGTSLLVNCTISYNTNGTGGILYGNDGNGGGIYNGGTLSMSNCVVVNNSNGSDDSASGTGGSGGGICNLGLSTLNSCLISSNAAGTGGGANDSFSFGGGAAGGGGGIFNGGSLILSNCTIEENSGGAGGGGGSVSSSTGSVGAPGGSGGSGGGIDNTNLLILSCCTICGNTGGNGGPGGNGQGLLWGGNGGNGGNGGGICNFGSITSVLCTIRGNLCGDGGAGGIGDGAGDGGKGGNGGGIFSAGTITMVACTVNANIGGGGGVGGVNFSPFSSAGGTGGAGGNGGGICDATSAQLASLSDTLVALNRAGTGGLGGNGSGGISSPPPPSLNGTNGIGRDVVGKFVSGGYNLVGEAGTVMGLTNGVNHDLVGTTNAPINPFLGPLQNNGGPTLTQALLVGSPAIDQGNSFGLTADQRGHVRPHDYYCIPNAPGGDGSDIGSFESDKPILVITKSGTGVKVIWDTNQPNYTLECTTNLGSGWTTITGLVSTAGREFQMTNQSNTGQTFFRLRSNQ